MISGSAHYSATPATQTVAVAANATASASVAYFIDPSVLASLKVSLIQPTIAVGQTTVALVTGLDQFGASVTPAPATWTSSAPAIATVNSSGVVTGVSSGVANITATVGPMSASAVVTVTAPLQSVAACKPAAGASAIGLGFPRNSSRQKAIGDVRVPVVFVDFSDAVATRTPQNVFAILSPTASSYYAAVSYGRMNLILEPSLVWRRMSKPSTGYGWDALSFNLHRTYIQEAVNLATGVDFSQADAIVVMSNPDAGALANGPAFVGTQSGGISAGGKTINNATTSGRDLTAWGGYWLNHEMGHLLGLPDLYGSAAPYHRYVGGFSLMGLISGQAREFFGWERWVLGWIDDAQVACFDKGTTEVVLSPVERVGGTKIVAIPTGGTTFVVVESRRAEGYDTNGSFTPGILVYFIDTSIATQGGVVKVLPINDADVAKGTAPLSVGGSLTYNGVTITFVSTDATGDRVRIAR